MSINLSAAVPIEVPFHDVDIMNVAWHGHYFKYFELARTAVMRAVDLDWPAIKELGFAMPVVNAHVSFRRPLLYGEKYLARATISEYALPELVVNYQIEDPSGKKVFATGQTRQVYFDLATQAGCYTLPPTVQARFERFVKER